MCLQRCASGRTDAQGSVVAFNPGIAAKAAKTLSLKQDVV